MLALICVACYATRNEAKVPEPIHPGVYIKNEVLPHVMGVKEAAKLLGVGRPALSNLLNGNAALSSEMAARLEKVFGVDPQELLKRQAEFDRYQQRASAQNLAVAAYVPSFLKITARGLEQWVDGNLEARSHLPVLLRKLVNSTGQDLTLVDFPGYDNAEKKGWDGRIDAGAATPWIPIGKSGWEFGCNEDPKKKADGDYAARSKAIPAAERAELDFVFVTPRHWAAKDKWIKDKQSLGDWKSVKAYDASDIEQWLEQSIQAQTWLAERMGSPTGGVYSLDQQWEAWASVTDPTLSRDLFSPSVERYAGTFKAWTESIPAAPLVVCGDSKLEALAFLYCMFDSDDSAYGGYKDRALVFSSPQALRKLTTASPSFLPILVTEEVERELGGTYKKCPTIIIRPRNTVEPEPGIVLDLLGHEAFRKALAAMGIDDHLKVDSLARESGYSPTILRRRLSKIPGIRRPAWAQDAQAVERLIPMMLVGSWHTQSKGDCEILSFLADAPYEAIEKDVAQLLRFDDPPIWSIGKFRGVLSKIDAFFAVHAGVTQKDIDAFLYAARMVLSEKDPALELPEDKRAFANLYGKSREHSGALRDGICETLVLLAVHGSHLFASRLGIDMGRQIDSLVRDLLTPLTEERLLSQTSSLPLYAEAAPLEFLRIIEEDLRRPEPQVYRLMKPAGSGLFGGGCPRTGLLWALENLAWKPDQLPRVCQILARLAERKISDNWVNKPENSLQSIFRSWMPQTAASIEDRKKTLEVVTQKFPAIGWQICVAQFAPAHRVGDYSQRPRWRSDASGAGQPISTWPEIHDFAKKALDLALAWPSHDENTLGDLVSNLQGLPEEDQETVWDLVGKWAAKETDEGRKAALRETIRRFAFVRRGTKQGLKTEIRDRARRVYDRLTPTDLVTRHQWLFEKQWVDESFEELEEPDFDYNKREERIRKLRIEALQEIWYEKGFDGIAALLSKSGATWIIGWHLAEGVLSPSGIPTFMTQCLNASDDSLHAKFDEVIRGGLHRLDAEPRRDIVLALINALPSSLTCRLLKCCPFQHETWGWVDSQGPELRKQYWQEIYPNWLTKDSPDLNEVVDRLLEAGRPRAAFYAAHFALEEVETSRLKRLLHEVGTSNVEAPGSYQVDAYHLSEALITLQGRAGVSEEEMARLEFLFITALEHSKHRIPNLERQVGKSPALFVQALALIFRRNDGGEDPPEWRVNDAEQRSAIGTAAYRLFENVKRIPGTDEAGKIDEEALRTWVKQAKDLCATHGRAEIGDQKIGQILSAPVVGDDGIWPCEPVRKVLEECGTSDVALGVQVGVYNSRGAHWRAEGGSQERALAEKYRNWARKLAFEYPYVSDMVEGIASRYDRQAVMEDAESAVRKRLRV